MSASVDAALPAPMFDSHADDVAVPPSSLMLLSSPTSGSSSRGSSPSALSSALSSPFEGRRVSFPSLTPASRTRPGSDSEADLLSELNRSAAESRLALDPPRRHAFVPNPKPALSTRRTGGGRRRRQEREGSESARPAHCAALLSPPSPRSARFASTTTTALVLPSPRSSREGRRAAAAAAPSSHTAPSIPALVPAAAHAHSLYSARKFMAATTLPRRGAKAHLLHAGTTGAGVFLPALAPSVSSPAAALSRPESKSLASPVAPVKSHYLSALASSASDPPYGAHDPRLGGADYSSSLAREREREESKGFDPHSAAALAESLSGDRAADWALARTKGAEGVAHRKASLLLPDSARAATKFDRVVDSQAQAILAPVVRLKESAVEQRSRRARRALGKYEGRPVPALTPSMTPRALRSQQTPRTAAMLMLRAPGEGGGDGGEDPPPQLCWPPSKRVTIHVPQADEAEEKQPQQKGRSVEFAQMVQVQVSPSPTVVSRPRNGNQNNARQRTHPHPYSSAAATGPLAALLGVGGGHSVPRPPAAADDDGVDDGGHSLPASASLARSKILAREIKGVYREMVLAFAGRREMEVAPSLDVLARDPGELVSSVSSFVAAVWGLSLSLGEVHGLVAHSAAGVGFVLPRLHELALSGGASAGTGAGMTLATLTSRVREQHVWADHSLRDDYEDRLGVLLAQMSDDAFHRHFGRPGHDERRCDFLWGIKLAHAAEAAGGDESRGSRALSMRIRGARKAGAPVASFRLDDHLVERLLEARDARLAKEQAKIDHRTAVPLAISSTGAGPVRAYLGVAQFVARREKEEQVRRAKEEASMPFVEALEAFFASPDSRNLIATVHASSVLTKRHGQKSVLGSSASAVVVSSSGRPPQSPEWSGSMSAAALPDVLLSAASSTGDLTSDVQVQPAASHAGLADGDDDEDRTFLTSLPGLGVSQGSAAFAVSRQQCAELWSLLPDGHSLRDLLRDAASSPEPVAVCANFDELRSFVAALVAD